MSNEGFSLARAVFRALTEHIRECHSATLSTLRRRPCHRSGMRAEHWSGVLTPIDVPFDQHDRVAEAIAAGEPVAAQAAMDLHFDLSLKALANSGFN